VGFNPIWSLSKHITRLRHFPLLVKCIDASFLLDPRNWIDNRLAAGVPFETEQLAWAARIISEEQLDTLIDVGANIGIYTVLLGRLPQIERVLAFEPIRRNFNQLSGNVFANSLDLKVDAYRVALSDRAARRTIHIDPISTGVSRLELTDCNRDVSVFTQEEEIRSARFDDLVTLKDRRIYLKIDVEGHALQALLGMERLFKSNRIFMQIEVDEATEQSVYKLLLSYDMMLTNKIGSDWYLSPRGSIRTAPHEAAGAPDCAANPA
jgi:FkbM family methyltransferase